MNSDIRNARILYAILMVMFGVASCVYAIAPGYVVSQFAMWDKLLGGGAEYPETQNRVWIALAAANVATLSLMSWLLWSDIRKNRAVHLPLLFMKSVSASLFIAYLIAHPGARSLLVAAVGDFATAGALIYFPMRAFKAIDAGA